MIQIKAFYGNWREVTREAAKAFILSLMSGMMCSEDRKIEIAQRHVKGITISELLEG